jgi:hypothetical protein
LKIDLTGQKFGKLTVLYEADKIRFNSKKTARTWRCICECGTEKTILQASLRSGNTKSCGCGCVENRNRILNKKGVSKKDYPSNNRLERILGSMRQRCFNPNVNEYYRYGGRGITVCDEWMDKKNGMKNFVLWALSNGYSDELTIDRIDNDKGYSPENCKWSDRFEQMSNTSVSIKIPYKSKTYNYNSLGRELGISASTIRKWYLRGFESGEEIIQAINNSIKKYPQTAKYYGSKVAPQTKVCMATKGLAVEL